MKRALRLDKIRLAALEATLRLYRDPGRLVQRLPTLRLLGRPQVEIAAMAEALAPAVAARLGVAVTAVACDSQVGSGALPTDTLPSAGLRLAPEGCGAAPERLAARLRGLPRPVIGRIADGAVILDLRCLERGEALLEALGR